MNDEFPLGRLAFRVEGGFWVAYYKINNNISFYLGNIAMDIVSNDPKIKNAFMDLMKSVVSKFVEKNTGWEPTWLEPQQAPENERSGHA